MKKKKMVALLLVATMVASALSGCGGGSKDASESAGNVTESADSGSVKELTFYNADEKEDPWTDPVATALTEATGVKLKTSYPVSSVEEDVALMIAKIASGRVCALLDTDWDYADGENVLKNDGQYGKTYAALPLTIDENTLCPSLMYQGLVTGYGVGISSDCEDPVAAIKFLDYLCSDEGQVLVQWGIEGENYEVDESGKRYRTEEEIEYSTTDPDYSKKTGVGFHSYPFPCYGDGVMDSTGSTYTKNNKEEVIAAYNEEEKAACEAWNVELLADIFPQADKFAVPAFSPVWAYTTPSEFDEITTQLDEIAWSSLISCVMASEDKFDETYDKMISDLESAGMKDAETMLSDIIKEKAGV